MKRPRTNRPGLKRPPTETTIGRNDRGRIDRVEKTWGESNGDETTGHHIVNQQNVR